MTTQLEQAAKLALEALECLVDTEQSFGALDYGDNAISALRNALAQPTQNTPVGSFLFGGGRWNQVDAEYENDHDVVKLYRLPQQPAQDEPWGACVSGRVFVGNLPEHVRRLAEDGGLPIQWLYTRPANSMNSTESSILLDAQARDVELRSTERKETFLQPLTDEQIDAIRDNLNIGWTGDFYRMESLEFGELIRAIEAAHGIGEKK